MIVTKHNILSDTEIEKLLTLWFDTDKNHIITDGYKYHIEALEILDYLEELKLNYSFAKEHYRDLILQTIDETHSQAPNHNKFHRHENEWTYVMYLNDNYDGGEIEFINGTVIKPKTGDVIYFSPEEGHRIHPPSNFTEQYFNYNGSDILMNKRWSLVGFMNSDIINENKKTCLI